MSGHSKWSTIKHKKAVRDHQRGDLFTKAAKDITVAVRVGGSPDPEANFALRLAVEKAKALNMPKDNIERAIARGAGIQGAALEELVLEAYGPGGRGIIIRAITDNRNRTVAEVKNILEKAGGRLGERGSVIYLFEKLPSGEYRAKYQSPPTEPSMEVLIELLTNHPDVQKAFTI